MQQRFSQWLQAQGYEFTDITALIMVLGLILVISVAIHFIFHRVVLRFLDKMAQKSQKRWRKAFFERKLFTRIALAIQGIIIYVQAGLWLKPETEVLQWVQTISILWVLLFILLAAFSLLDALLDISSGESRLKGLP